LIAISQPLGMPRPPSGPAIGVVEMTISPPATVQHVHGARAISSSRRQRAGAVPVRMATWAVAMAMPAPKQAA
jgi:hypothetical protein